MITHTWGEQSKDSSEDTIFGLLSIILARFDGWWLVLTGFLDETETHTNNPITGVAGFLYRKEDLASLEKEWATRTQMLTKPFRTAECNARRCQFEHWSDDECQRLISDLCEIVGRYRGTGFVCTVENKQFTDWLSRSKSAFFLSKPYTACLTYVVGMIHHQLKDNGLLDNVFYNIEAGANGEKEATDILRRLRDNPALKERYQLEGYVFLPKQESSAALLGTADLLAWQYQKEYKISEQLEKEGQSDVGLGDQFKLFFPDEKSPPIAIYHFSPLGLDMLALNLRLSGLHRD